MNYQAIQKKLIKKLLLTKIVEVAFFLFFATISLQLVNGQSIKKPNIVFIVIDDLNDFPEGFYGHPQAKTPHIKALGNSGVRFKNAYSNNPLCGPSRASLFTGVYPHNSSHFWMKPWLENDVLINTKTIMEKFKESGYYVVGSGKVLHHNKLDVWTEYKYKADYSPFVYAGNYNSEKKPISHPDVPAPFRTNRIVDGLNMGGGFIDGSFGPMKNFGKQTFNGERLWWVYGGFRSGKELKYINEENRDLTPDELNAEWAHDKLLELAEKQNQKPFFLSVGFLRPHTPLIVPQKYFDMYPLDSIKLVNILPRDKDDTFLHMVDQFETKKRRTRSVEMFENLIASYENPLEGLKRFTQAYLACVSAVDDNVGKVISAINNSSLKDNTIIILTSDHGWTMGQKDHIYKNSLWEESTRVPLIMRVPSISAPNSTVNHPVSLIDLYPTMLELAGINYETKKNNKGHELDGYSLVPFIKNPLTTNWDGPRGALSVVYSSDINQYIPQNHHYSIVTKNFRYIVYNTGQEELYDRISDPDEHVNLIYKNSHPETKYLRDLIKSITYPMIPQGISLVENK